MAQLKVLLENIIPLTEARDHFSQIVTEVQKDKLYVLTKGGKPAVAIIDVKYLESVTGGEVKTEYIETEIQKDPSKVGRTPMIKHEASSEPSSLVFPKTDAPLPAAPEPAPQPIKINFQPASDKPITPPVPSTPPTPTPPPIIPPAPIDTPPPPITPPPTPASPSQDGPITTPSIVNTPIPPTPPTNSPGSVIDMIPTPEEETSSTTSRVAQDDKPGPAQYAGEDNDEPEDMEI